MARRSPAANLLIGSVLTAVLAPVAGFAGSVVALQAAFARLESVPPSARAATLSDGIGYATWMAPIGNGIGVLAVVIAVGALLTLTLRRPPPQEPAVVEPEAVDDSAVDRREARRARRRNRPQHDAP